MEDRTLSAKAQPLLRTRLCAGAWGIVSVQMLLMVATLALFWPTTLSMFAKWQPSDSDTYGHGYLILAICFWLLIRNRHRVQDVVPQSNLLAATALIAVAGVWLVALRSGIQSAHQALMPVLMWLAICAALGPRIALRCSFAIGYLFFAVPIWDVINSVLQSATVVATDVLLKLTHVNAYVDGNIVHLAAGIFEIAGGCSGLHFFIVALALAALYGEMSDDSIRVRVSLVVFAAVLAALSNWVRVYAIILAGYLTDMHHYLVRVEHYRFGWAVFAVMMTLFLVIARRLPAKDAEVVRVAVPIEVVSREVLTRCALLGLIALAVVPVWNLLVPVRAAAAPAALLPLNPGQWQGPGAQIDRDDWKPAFAGADVARWGNYASGGRHVVMYTAAYLSQEPGRQLAGYANSVVGHETQLVSQARLAGAVPKIEAVVEDKAGTAVIWYFYQVGGAVTNRGAVAGFSYGLRSLIGAPLSRVVAARSACIPDCRAARAALADFMDAVDASQSISSPTPKGAHL